MDRHARWVMGSLGLCLALGCTGIGNNRVREAAAPDARNMLTEGPNLLPVMPVSATGPTRGQKPEQPVTQTSAVAGQSNPQVAVRIWAQVNGMPIMEDEVREAVMMRMSDLAKVPEAQRGAAFKELTEREVDRLIDRELILQHLFTRMKDLKKTQLLEELRREAAKESEKRLKDIKTAIKAKSDEEFKAMLAQQGISVDGFRRQTERNFMMQQYLSGTIYPTVKVITLEQMRDYYDQNPSQFEVTDRVKWLDLFIDASRFPSMDAARQHAQTLIERAKAGEDFAELVKKYDQGDSSLRGGTGLGEKRGEIQPAAAEPVLMTLKAGEVGPLIDLGFGYHVVKAIERDYAGREPFDDKCQAKVREKLRNQMFDRELKQFVAELKRNATVVINPN